MAVTTKFTGDEKDLIRAQDNVATSAAKITAEYNANVKAAKELETAAKKIWKESETPQQEYARRMEQIKTLYQKNMITSDQYYSQSQKAQDKLNAATQTGIGKLGDMTAGLGRAAAAAGAALSIFEEMANSAEVAYQRSLQIQQSGADTNQLMKSFMAQQPEGLREARFDQVVAAAGGMMAPGEAAGVAQGLYSASRAATEAEKFAEVIKTMEEMNTAFGRGLAGGLSGEVATQAMNLGMDPAGLIRAVVAAGDTSSRDAKDIAPTASAWRLFEDRMLGVAVASTLAEGDPGTAKNAAESVAKTLTAVGEQFKDLQDWFQQNGLGPEATQAQRLAMMQQKGIDSPAELIGIGVKEDVAVRSMTAILQQFQHMQDILARSNAAYGEQGFLRQNVEGLQSELPNLALADEQKRAEANRLAKDAFDTSSQAAVLRQQMLYDEARKRGLDRDQLGEPLFKPDGQFADNGIGIPFTNIGLPNAWNYRLQVLIDQVMGDNRRRDMEREIDRRIEEIQRGKPQIQKQEH